MCESWYFVLFLGSPETEICRVTDKKCYENIEVGFKDKAECGCEDQCERLNYQISKLYHSEHYTQIQFWLESTTFYPLIRQKAFSVSDFIGSIGGLVGLFAGMSVISLVEFMFDIVEAIKLKVHITKIRSKVHPMPTIISDYVQEIHLNCNHFLYRYSVYVLYFTKSSSIHGINHIGNKNKSLAERFFWIVMTFFWWHCALSWFLTWQRTLSWLRSSIVSMRNFGQETM